MKAYKLDSGLKEHRVHKTSRTPPDADAVLDILKGSAPVFHISVCFRGLGRTSALFIQLFPTALWLRSRALWKTSADFKMHKWNCVHYFGVLTTNHFHFSPPAGIDCISVISGHFILLQIVLFLTCTFLHSCTVHSVGYEFSLYRPGRGRTAPLTPLL